MNKWKAILAIAASFVIAGGAWGQSYPTRPIKLVVPFSAGGSTDLIARLVAEQVRRELGQPVIVENRAGAAGPPGGPGGAGAAADRYALPRRAGRTLTVFPPPPAEAG